MPEASCVVFSKEYEVNHLRNRNSNTRHITGNHFSDALILAICSCDSACTSRLSFRVEDTLCGDTGVVSAAPGYKHVPKFYWKYAEHVVPQAYTSGAKGSAAWVCLIEDCLIGLGCKGQFTVGFDHYGLVSITFTGGELIDDLSISG